jgi:hypothetical protein
MFKKTLEKNSGKKTKINNKKKIKAGGDAHSTLDYYQRRVNKGKIK